MRWHRAWFSMAYGHGMCLKTFDWTFWPFEMQSQPHTHSHVVESVHTLRREMPKFSRFFGVVVCVFVWWCVYTIYIYIISLLLSVMHDRPAADQRQRALWHGCWAAPLVAINQLIILFYFSSVLPLLRAVVYIGVCSVCCFRSTYWNFKYFDFRLYYCFGCALLLFSDDRLSVPFMFLKWFEGKKNWSISTSHAQGNHYDINHPLFVLISNAMTMLGW